MIAIPWTSYSSSCRLVIPPISTALLGLMSTWNFQDSHTTGICTLFATSCTSWSLQLGLLIFYTSISKWTPPVPDFQLSFQECCSVYNSTGVTSLSLITIRPPPHCSSALICFRKPNQDNVEATLGGQFFVPVLFLLRPILVIFSRSSALPQFVVLCEDASVHGFGILNGIALWDTAV